MSLSLKQKDWPAQDRTMWTRLVSQGDLLEDTGPLAHLRETSQASLISCYGRWLCWLATQDPEALHLPPAHRATMERLTAWLKAMSHTAPMTQLRFIEGVLRILTSAEADLDWGPQWTLRKRLKTRAGRGEQTRKIGKILSSDVLLQAGLTLALQSADKASGPLFRASRIRNGAMIALLALVPIRRRALASLRLGTSFLVSDSRMRVVLSPDMTKSGHWWETDVPEAVWPAMRRYLTEARPTLLERGDPRLCALWINRQGGLLAERSVGPTVTNAMWAQTGIRVPPHYFRDAAATTLARHAPRSATMISPILGHASSRTAERHYNHAQTIDAGRTYAKLIAQRKKQTPP